MTVTALILYSRKLFLPTQDAGAYLCQIHVSLEGLSRCDTTSLGGKTVTHPNL